MVGRLHFPAVLILLVSSGLADPSNVREEIQDSEIRNIKLILQEYGEKIASLQQENEWQDMHITLLESENGAMKLRIEELEKKTTSLTIEGNARSADDNVIPPVSDRSTPVQEDVQTTGRKPVNTKGIVVAHVPLTPEKRVGSGDNTIAFHAILTQAINDASMGHPVLFDHIATNIGAHISGKTGVFTCTRSGVYLFAWSIKVNVNQWFATELVRNAAVLGTGMSGDANFWTTGSATVITHLDPTDEVWVRVSGYDTNRSSDILPTFTMFSGVLIQ